MRECVLDGNAAQHDPVGAGRCNPSGELVVVACLWVERSGAGDLDSEGLRCASRVGGVFGPVLVAVPGQEEPLDAFLLCEPSDRRGGQVAGGGVRTKFRSPVGYRCSEVFGVLTPRTSRVRADAVLAGLIIARGPFGAWFATGISGPEQPEL